MTSKRWRYIDDPQDDGVINMATDLALLTACNQDSAPPTLRLYGWNRPTLSVGYSQRGWDLIDIHYCREQKIPIVRRPTGGRILLHNAELTYSIVAPLDYPGFPKGLRRTHRVISEALVNCLNQLKLSSPAKVHLKNRFEPSEGLKTTSCFAYSNSFEVTVGGKKIIGSSQRRLRKAFLQHGSILLKFEPDSINQVMRFQNPKDQESHLNQLKERGCGLETLCREEISFSQLKDIFYQTLTKTLAKEAVLDRLTEYERNLRDSFIEVPC